MGAEEVKKVGATTTISKYYAVDGLPTAMKQDTTYSYLASDGLGSVSEALGTDGSATSQQLFTAYGASRYTNGTWATQKAFTGQYGDPTTGLDYYNARYYDPVPGQFASADTWADGGLNRFGYVGGNPATRTDPTGHAWYYINWWWWYGVIYVTSSEANWIAGFYNWGAGLWAVVGAITYFWKWPTYAAAVLAAAFWYNSGTLGWLATWGKGVLISANLNQFFTAPFFGYAWARVPGFWWSLPVII
jgi:RHS repeat-associated protein